MSATEAAENRLFRCGEAPSKHHPRFGQTVFSKKSDLIALAHLAVEFRHLRFRMRHMGCLPGGSRDAQRELGRWRLSNALFTTRGLSARELHAVPIVRPVNDRIRR